MAAEIVPMVMCKSNEHCVVQVPSSDGSKKYTCTFGPTPGGEYAYGWECSCKSFEFRKTCKHIAEAEESMRFLTKEIKHHDWEL